MSNDKKQTAVEWLFEQYKLIGMITTAQVDKAKEMEKQQQLHSYADGQADTLLMFKQKISKMKDIPSEFNQLISENFWDLV
jgi:hypothetical protein